MDSGFQSVDAITNARVLIQEVFSGEYGFEEAPGDQIIDLGLG
jgi:hypothetical protein